MEASGGNVIVGNVITNNLLRGIFIYRSGGNTVIQNEIITNDIGIFTSTSNGNAIYHNNFIGNTEQAYSAESIDTWMMVILKGVTIGVTMLRLMIVVASIRMSLDVME